MQVFTATNSRGLQFIQLLDHISLRIQFLFIRSTCKKIVVDRFTILDDIPYLIVFTFFFNNFFSVCLFF